MPFNDKFPFDDKDGKTWYQVGYRSGLDSGNSQVLNLEYFSIINFPFLDNRLNI